MDKQTGLVFVNRDGLMNGLALTLRNLEKGNVIYTVGEGLSDDLTIARTDDIFVDGKRVFHHESLKNKKYVGCYPNHNMITIADAFDIVKPLYEQFPYLEIIMNRVAMDMFLSDGNDIREKMVDAAVWYEAYMPYTEQILSLQKLREN